MCVKNAFGLPGPLELQLEVEKVLSRDRESAIALLDMKMKNKLATKASQISKELLLKGLLKPFPTNCISLMTISGAKGSTVSWSELRQTPAVIIIDKPLVLLLAYNRPFHRYDS